MAKYDAVDRLMALATEKRADRVPLTQAPVTGEQPAAHATGLLAPAVSPLPPAESARDQDWRGDDRASGRATAAERGRQFWNAIRPMLPMVAGAMRMVDHGAVQAVARLLPLVSGGAAGLLTGPGAGANADAGAARAAAARTGADEQTGRAIAALQAAQQAVRLDLDSLRGQAEELDTQVRTIRTQMERVTAEQQARAQETRALNDRVRLLTAGTIILLMLVVAQMILLVVIFHR